MTETDFQIVPDGNATPCFHCRIPFDPLTARWCECITRDRTLVCPRCGGCACGASLHQRNEFWIHAPAALWERRRSEQKDSMTRLHAIDPATLPRPFALIVDDDPLVLAVTERALRANDVRLAS